MEGRSALLAAEAAGRGAAGRRHRASCNKAERPQRLSHMRCSGWTSPEGPQHHGHRHAWNIPDGSRLVRFRQLRELQDCCASLCCPATNSHAAAPLHKASLTEAGTAVCKEGDRPVLKQPQPQTLVSKGSLDTEALACQHMWLETTQLQHGCPQKEDCKGSGESP